MKTAYLLLARYDGLPIISVEEVCRDFFRHLTPVKFLRKVADGSIHLPLIRMEASQKSAKGVYVDDLAAYLDAQRAEALREYDQLHG